MNAKIPVIAILAGGESSRMGRDKAQLPFGAATMLEHLAGTALAVAPRVLIVGRERPATWTVPQVEFVPDQVPGLGPVGALSTVLCLEKSVLALACDLPLLNTTALRWLIEKRSACQALNGLIVDNDGQWEPLFSIYNRACLPLIAENLASGRRSLHALIKLGDFEFVNAPPEIAAQLVNVNTPEDWEALKVPHDC